MWNTLSARSLKANDCNLFARWWGMYREYYLKGKYQWTADLLFILCRFSCLAYVEWTTFSLPWSNPNQLNRRSAVLEWFSFWWVFSGNVYLAAKAGARIELFLFTVMEPFLRCDPGALCCSGMSLLISISLESSGMTWDKRSPKFGLLSGGGLSRLTVSSEKRTGKMFSTCLMYRAKLYWKKVGHLYGPIE